MKRYIRTTIVVIIFIVCYNILRITVPKILTNWISNNVELSKLTTTNIVAIILMLVSALLAFLTSYTLKRLDNYYQSQKEAPFLSFFTSKKIVVTGIKKKRKKGVYEVELGEKQARFRYVNAIIRNTGKKTIANCQINNLVLRDRINPQEEIQIFFLVYEMTGYVIEKERKYTVQYEFLDEEGNRYRGKSVLIIGSTNETAYFRAKKKQRRID